MSEPHARRAGAQQCGRSDIFERQTATSGHFFGTHQALKSGDRRVHDVDRVVGSERLRQDIVDACALEHGTHRAAGDNAGTGAGRAQQHDASRRLASDRVRDRVLDARHLEEALLGFLDTLGDGGRNFLGLAVTDADAAVTVADDNQRGEAEAPTTLDDLGDAVDRDDALDVLRLLRRRAATVTTVAAPLVAAAGRGRSRTRTAAALRTWHQTFLSMHFDLL